MYTSRRKYFDETNVKYIHTYLMYNYASMGRSFNFRLKHTRFFFLIRQNTYAD